MSFHPQDCLSSRTEQCYERIMARIGELERLKPYQSRIVAMFDNPKLTVLAPGFSETCRQLGKFGLVNDPEALAAYIRTIHTANAVSFREAPGSRMNHHHAYPGGLVVHIAADIENALATASVYQNIYGVNPDRELLIAALAVHDIAKPCLFPWLGDGIYPNELQIAGTAGHHIFSIAELIHRGFPRDIVKAAACCHMTTAAPERDLENYLQAAFLIAGRKPPLPNPGRITVEDWLCMYADSDGDIIAWVRRELSEIPIIEKGPNKKELLRILAQKSELLLYQEINTSRNG